jgi:hypothetical protein
MSERRPGPWSSGRPQSLQAIRDGIDQAKSEAVREAKAVIAANQEPEVRQITTDDELRAAMQNGYTVRLCSPAGFRPPASALLYCLRRIINELPANRDWLDPALEAAARDAIANAERNQKSG